MKTIAVLLLVATLIACAQSFSLRQLVFGTCAEMCGLGMKDCPDGQSCQSNGCGHTCQPTAVAVQPACPFAVMCALYCPSGYAHDANGCMTCSCQDSPFEFFP